MMKKRQKRRWLALLMPLCLALSICVAPVSAEGKSTDLERLEQELLVAKEEAVRKQDALGQVEADADAEKAAAADAEREARDELAAAEAELEEGGEDDRARLEERIADAERRIDEALEKMAAADARVRDAQDAAEAAALLAAQKQDAYDAAQEAEKQRQEEEERRQQEEEQKRKEEEEKKKQEEAEKQKQEEEQKREEEEQKKQEEERRKQEEEERRQQEEEQKRKEEEEKRKQEEAEKQKQEEEQKRKEEEQKKQEEKRRELTPGSADLSFSESGIAFGSLEKGASRGLSRTFTITNNSSRYAMALSASSPSGFSVSGVPASLSPGKSAVVTVSLNSTEAAGEYSRSVSISGYYEDGGLKGDSRTFSIPVYAKVMEKGLSISIDSSRKDLGRLKEGYSEKDAGEKEFTVTIKNEGADSVYLNGAKGAEHFTVDADRSGWLDPGGKAVFTIAPKQNLKAGSYTDKIVFQAREGVSAECKVSLAVEKQAAALTVEPGTLDFGSVEEGYSAVPVKTVVVRNSAGRGIFLEQPASYSWDISSLDKNYLAEGDSAVFTIRPRTGLPANRYDGVIEVRSSGGEAAEVHVKFIVNRPAGPSAFFDVEPGSTFDRDIAYVSQNGLMSGKGGGFFCPQEAVTRGQIVTILYRLEGQPAVSGASLPDVAAGSYCEKAVKWAVAAGITGGDGNGLFRPNDPVTREQLAAFLYRYHNYKGYPVGWQADLGAFPDGASVASYAREAFSWANGAGLINGTSGGYLNPSGRATRGQAAAILHRYCVNTGRQESAA